MNIFSFGSGELRNIDPEKQPRRAVAALAAMISRCESGAGVGVRERKMPWGVIRSYDGSGSFSPPIFAPKITKSGGKTRVSFDFGLIAGIEPKIGDTPISQKDQKTGRQPFVEVPDFNERGEVYVYFRLKFGKQWSYDAVEAVAKKDVPIRQPYEAWKLAVILYKDGRSFRALYSNQGHLAVARRAGGDAMHHFWSLF